MEILTSKDRGVEEGQWQREKPDTDELLIYNSRTCGVDLTANKQEPRRSLLDIDRIVKKGGRPVSSGVSSLVGAYRNVSDGSSHPSQRRKELVSRDAKAGLSALFHIRAPTSFTFRYLSGAVSPGRKRLRR